MPPGPHAGNRNRPAYSGHTRFRFPKSVIQLFAPRKPIEFKPPPRKRRLKPMTGVADFVSLFDKKPDSESAAKDSNKDVVFETPARRRRRKREEKLGHVEQVIAEARSTWDPFAKREGVVKTGDSFKTLFVFNVAYETLEARLHDEFEAFGNVVMVVIPKDRDGVPRGYAFVEFERERDLKVAYRQAAGMRVDGRRLHVDVERGRTVKHFWPNRLDGPNNACVRQRKQKRKSDAK